MVGFVSESTNLPLPISKSHPTFGKHITVDFDRDNKEKKKLSVCRKLISSGMF